MISESDGFDQDQWPRRCTGLTEPVPGRLRLRVALLAGEAVCDVFVEERAERVELEVLVCAAPGRAPRDAGAAAGPSDVEIHLRAPLHGRAVVDAFTGLVVPGADPRQSDDDECDAPASPARGHVVRVGRDVTCRPRGA